MAKGGKLTKLLRKMQSIGRNGGWPRNTSAVTASHADKSDPCFSSAAPCDKISGDLQPVYVGKSRRQYLISSEVIQNPLFRQLVGRSSSDQFDGLSVGCEVVLFEHLLWMLDNADPQPESLDELVEFYV